MADEPRGLPNQLKAFWDNLPPRRRAVLVGATLATILAVVVVTRTGKKGEYSTLFANLAPDDANEVLSDLQRRGVDHRLKDDGRTIEVPSKKVHEVRIAMAAAGLPRGGVGFEIFDGQSFGTSSFVEQINFRRATQGELARSIAALGAVESARVHLAMGNRSVFRDADEKPTASVAVRMHSGATLTRDQVRGIVHLVAASIDGLSADKVVVIDDRGNVLSATEDDASGTEARSDLEQSRARQIRTLLERAVGAGRVAVTVTAQLDQRQIDQTEEIYDNEKAALRSEARTVEGKFDAGEIGGIAGTRGNLPGAAAPTAASGGGDTSRLQETRNFEVSRVVRHTVEAPVRIQKLHVAILVDYARDEEGKPVARTAAQLEELSAIANRAAGIDADRGDIIEMRSVPFADQLEEGGVESAAPIAKQLLPVPVWMVGAGAGGLGFLVILIIVLRGRRKGDRPEIISLPARIADVEAAISSPNMGSLGAFGGDASRVGSATPIAALGGSTVHTRVASAVRTDSTRASRVISEWLAEGNKEKKAS